MFRNAREIFELFGFKVRIDYSWFIIAALMVWILATSYFPPLIPNMEKGALYIIATIAMLGLFASLILHELSHSLVARYFGLKVGNITLFIFGGVAELEHDPESAKSEFWIAIAGPIMSFLLGAFFFTLATMTSTIAGTDVVSAVLQYLAIANLILAIFNLIPAFPLDGGRVLRAVLWHYKKDILSATNIAGRIGSVFGLLLIGIGILGFLSSQFVAGMWQVLIGLFILAASRSAQQDIYMRRAMKNHSIDSLMTRNPWVSDVNDTVQYLVDHVMLKHNVSFVPVLDENKILGFVDAAMIQTIEQENWRDTKVGDIFAATNNHNSIQSQTPLEDAFNQMRKTGRRKFLILKDDKLEGVISLADLMSFLSLRSGLGLPPDKHERAKKPYPTAHA